MNRMEMGSWMGWFLVAVACTAPAVTSQADVSPDIGHDPVSELLSCGAQGDDRQRLTCYDALRDAYSAHAEVEAPEASPLADASPQSAQQSTQQREEAEFGVEHHQSNKNTSEITSAVVSVDRNALGALLLTLDNDQIWQQGGSSRIQVKVGDEVTISRGTMSAFYLRVNDGQRLTRFGRVR